MGLGLQFISSVLDDWLVYWLDNVLKKHVIIAQWLKWFWLLIFCVQHQL